MGVAHARDEDPRLGTLTAVALRFDVTVRSRSVLGPLKPVGPGRECWPASISGLFPPPPELDGIIDSDGIGLFGPKALSDTA